MYMYVCMYTYIYIHICVCVCVCHGSFGLKCLEEYEGEYLVLVGEWEVEKESPKRTCFTSTNIYLLYLLYLLYLFYLFYLFY